MTGFWAFEVQLPYQKYLQPPILKVAFFQKVRFVFQISQSPKKIVPKNYPKLEIWISCLLIWAGISNFKFRIVFWNNFFGRLGDLKNESDFLKKRGNGKEIDYWLDIIVVSQIYFLKYKFGPAKWNSYTIFFTYYVIMLKFIIMS